MDRIFIGILENKNGNSLEFEVYNEEDDILIAEYHHLPPSGDRDLPTHRLWFDLEDFNFSILSSGCVLQEGHNYRITVSDVKSSGAVSAKMEKFPDEDGEEIVYIKEIKKQ